MSKITVEKYEVPLIWAQRVNMKRISKGFRQGVGTVLEDIGNPTGPYLTGYEAGRAVNMKNPNNVSTILKGKANSVEGHRFYHDGTQTILIEAPNIDHYKNNNLLAEGKCTIELIEHNMRILELKDPTIVEFKHSHSKVSFECCNVNCEKYVKATYALLLKSNRPICAECSNVIASRNKAKENGLKSFEDAYPELKKYYHVSDNDGKLMSEISFGATTLVTLRCTCGDKQMPKEANHFNTRRKDELQFYCERCDSAGNKYPHLIKEWNNEKNTGTLFDYSTTCGERFWWKCEAGHSYYETIPNRIQTVECSRCVKVKKAAAPVQAINNVLLDIFKKDNKVEIDVEALINGFNYKHDFLIKFPNNVEVAFEYQGRVHHYNESRVGKQPRDVTKLAATRSNNAFVILLDDFNFGNQVVSDEKLFHFAILHALEHLKYNDFAVGCDIAYNKMKNDFSLNTQQAYYAAIYNDTFNTEFKTELFPSTMKCVAFQAEHKIF